MWIRTTKGNYINSDNIFSISVMQLPSGDISLTAYSITGAQSIFEPIAMFNSKADAKLYLDRLMTKIGHIIEISMEDWNYTGHKKDRKETRRGGS